jgi:hypothetical protein
MSHLDAEGERVEADDGYIGEAPQYVKCPKCFANPNETEHMQQRVHVKDLTSQMLLHRTPTEKFQNETPNDNDDDNSGNNDNINKGDDEEQEDDQDEHETTMKKTKTTKMEITTIKTTKTKIIRAMIRMQMELKTET